MGRSIGGHGLASPYEVHMKGEGVVLGARAEPAACRRGDAKQSVRLNSHAAQTRHGQAWASNGRYAHGGGRGVASVRRNDEYRLCVLLHNLKAGFVRVALRYYAPCGLFELYNMCSLAELDYVTFTLRKPT